MGAKDSILSILNSGLHGAAKVAKDLDRKKGNVPLNDIPYLDLRDTLNSLPPEDLRVAAELLINLAPSYPSRTATLLEHIAFFLETVYKKNQKK